MMKDNPKFIMSGGGTGGHIYPAIAIANELKSRFPKADILFVGAQDKMEMQKVPQAGYDIKGLWIAGIQRKLTLQNSMFPSVKAEQDISGDVGGNNDEGLEWLKNLVGSALDDKWFVLVCLLVFMWFVVSLVRILGKV